MRSISIFTGVMRKLFSIIVAFIAFGSLAAQSDSIYTAPEVPAQYPGGMQALFKYIRENVSQKTGSFAAHEISRKMMVSYIVDEEGDVGRVTVLKSSGIAGMDSLMLAAVNNMPAWAPAESPKGHKVKQRMTIPLTVCLK